MSVAKDQQLPQVRFVEDKPIDWRSVEHLMQMSARAGRFANFGPVQHKLAEAIAGTLGLADDRAAVPASSATAALFALIGLYDQAAGRPLRWAISAYGFVSTAIGPLANRVRVLDCSAQGLLDLAALSALPTDAWDGLLVTDLFGAQPDFAPLARYCNDLGKPMIIDAAVSFPARRPAGLRASEIVSFHHTKPWGFGEGGCAIVDAPQAPQVRALLNFGIGGDSVAVSCAANGKLSDIAAALILARLQTMPVWADGYREQRRRITGLAQSAGLALLIVPQADAVVPHVPVLAPRPIAAAELSDWPFAIAKYYRPLGGEHPVAADLYSRIVNVPCHPGMAAVSDAVLQDAFRYLARRSTLEASA